MALELYYTSSPRGLRPGASGLCTVAMTRTMSAALAARLESLCGYRPPAEGIPIERWPVALSHWIVDVGGVERHILASVRPVRPDHTMRSNTLAHFAVLHTSERDPAGAAWMLAQPETSATSWSGEPRLLDAERAMPRGGPSGACRCITWHSTAGDAGWAGVLANAAMLDPSKPTTVICPAGTRVLDLVAEALSLVPAAHRWRVTFTTYFTQPIAGLRCTWRFCLDGTSAAVAARQGGGLVIDACSPQPCTRTGAFIDAARSGRDPVLSPAADTGPARSRTARAAAPAAAGEIADAIVGEGSDRGPARSIPQRRPVGIDESASAQPSTGRAALGAAVIVAVALLALVAVMAVIMRSMGSRSAELEARLELMQQEMSQLSGSSTELESLRADVERLNGELGSANTARSALETKLEQLQNARAQPVPEEQPRSPESPARPAPDGQDAPAGAADSQAESAAGPSASAMPAGAAIRSGAAARNAVDVQGAGGRMDVIGSIAPPPIDALKDREVQLVWPAASQCSMTAISLTPSNALAQCGFTASDGSVLSFDVPGREMVNIARLDLSKSVASWTWLRGSGPKIQDVLLSRGLRLPDDWPAILGQLTLHATCADGRTMVAVMDPPRTLTWTVQGKATGRLTVDMLAALAVEPVVEWAGASIAITGNPDDSVLHHGGMGSVAARMTRKSPQSPLVQVTLDWKPSEAELDAMACIDELAASIASERALTVVWKNAQWMGGHTDAAAGTAPPSAAELSDVQARLSAWSADHAKGMATQAERDAFARQPLNMRATQFGAWLLESELKPMRQELTQLKGRCDQGVAEWSRSVHGTMATIRPDRDAPPVAIVTLQVQVKVPALPAFTESRVRGGGR